MSNTTPAIDYEKEAEAIYKFCVGVGFTSYKDLAERLRLLTAQAAEQAVNSRWIPVEIDLPKPYGDEYSKVVLVWEEYEGKMVCGKSQYNHFTNRWIGNTYVSHWQEIVGPQPPSTEEVSNV